MQKTPDAKNQVDVTLKLEEQNRNQLTFGAGVSQFEGFFGQLSFQTSNFLGRGESLTLSLQAGSRAENYQVAFTEPFLFDRNITGGVDVYKRSSSTSTSSRRSRPAATSCSGSRCADFSRLFMTYSYEQVSVTAIMQPGCLLSDAAELLATRNPFLQDSLLIGRAASARSARSSPSFVFNTDRQPDLPEHRPPAVAVERLRRARAATPTSSSRASKRSGSSGTPPRTSFGVPRPGRVHPAVRQHRGAADLRAAVPRRRVQHPRLRHPRRSVRAIRSTQLVLGGNKSLLFNAEYLHHDCRPGAAGAVLRRRPGAQHRPELRLEGGHRSRSSPPPPLLFDPFATTTLTAAGRVAAATTRGDRRDQRVQDVDRRRDPVLHAGAERAVPVDLRAEPAARVGVLDNNFQPAKRFTFRFAVGIHLLARRELLEGSACSG